MWPPWVKIRPSDPPSGDRRSPSPLARSPSFSLSTLKDVQALIRDDADDLRRHPISVVFHRVRASSSALRAFRDASARDRRIVVYYTSLGVIRKTADDCRAVRSILRGFRVAVDERDLSMDADFLAELKAALGPRRRGCGGQISLPQVFIGGRYVGGADEIRSLHECGELRQMIEGAPKQSIRPCEGCGGLRFMLCGSCRGGRKLYGESKGGVADFRCCGECNQNGLVRCPDCGSSAAF